MFCQFDLVDSAKVEYFQPGVPVLDRDNVGLILKLRPKTNLASGGTGEDCEQTCLVVANTHLLYNPNRHDIKLAQTVLLLSGRLTSLFSGTISILFVTRGFLKIYCDCESFVPAA